MTRYYDREQALFKEWKERFVVNGISEDLFAEDGLLFRGRIIYVNETGCWDREQGNEAELWDTAPKRLLVLTKDLYDDEPWDVRIETGRKKGSELPVLHNYFYPNLTLWSCSLLNACAGNEILMFDGDKCPYDNDELMKQYETLPIARINCKKAVGGSRCKSRELNDHIVKYGDLILRQIRMYDPDIILCCCGDHVFKNFIKKEYLPDLQQITVKGNWAHYSPSANKLVINSFHPSYFGMSRKNMYEYMMEDVKVFLEKYPGFIIGD